MEPRWEEYAAEGHATSWRICALRLSGSTER